MRMSNESHQVKAQTHRGPSPSLYPFTVSASVLVALLCLQTAHFAGDVFTHCQAEKLIPLRAPSKSANLGAAISVIALLTLSYKAFPPRHSAPCPAVRLLESDGVMLLILERPNAVLGMDFLY